MPIARRTMLAAFPALSAGALFATPHALSQPAHSAAPPDAFPAQDPTLVREMVGASHGNLDRVTALLKQAPRLANAAWDWGFGDWETALGAASHTGRRQIAELLLEHGARPDQFAYAMLGKLDAVKAMIQARPGLQRTRGPHSITLLAHARAGGPESAAVVEYLTGLGDADVAVPDLAISDEDHRAVMGEYSYGERADQRFRVFARDRDRALMLQRGDGAARGLSYQGSLSFSPAGAPEVRIAFTVENGSVVAATITSPAPVLTARRV